MGKRGQGEWSFTQRKDGLWTARKQFGRKQDGKPNVVAFYGKSKTEVRDKANEYERKLSDKATEVSSKETLYDYLCKWLKTYKYNSVKNTTYDALEDTVEIRVKPFGIAHIQLLSLTPQVCQEYINQLTACEAKYTIATIRKTYNTVNSCLKQAVKLGDIAKNPMESVSLPTEDNVQTKTKEISYFTEQQADEIAEMCSKKFSNGANVYYYGDLIKLLLFTGMRIGECIGLKWQDVDLGNNTIEVKRTSAMVKNRDGSSKKRVLKDGTPKTKKSSRTIPIPNKAVLVLNEVKTKYNKSKSSDFVFVTQTGGRPSARNVTRCFDSILRQCGINSDDYGLHSLRHPYIKYTTKNIFKKSKISFTPQTESRKGIRSQSCCRGTHKPV